MTLITRIINPNIPNNTTSDEAALQYAKENMGDYKLKSDPCMRGGRWGREEGDGAERREMGIEKREMGAEGEIEAEGEMGIERMEMEIERKEMEEREEGEGGMRGGRWRKETKEMKAEGGRWGT